MTSTAPKVGDTLTVIAPAVAPAYQWYRNGAQIPGATGRAYTLTSADIGPTITADARTLLIDFVNTPAAPPAPPSAAFPGQAGNPVGYAAAAGYPGSLTPMSASFTSGSTYSFMDFDAGAGSTQLPSGLDNVTFVGCRFQSNNRSFANVYLTGATNIIFSYCSFTPRVSLVGATPPGGGVWPSNGAGAGVIDQTSPTGYQIAEANCYQYGINLSTAGTGGPVTIDHCDIWGGQNLITFYNTTAPMTVRDCWLHDFGDAGRPSPHHQDGPGYLNGAVGPTNVALDHNTICGIANGNLIAFQGRTGGSSALTITRNFICGGSYCAMLKVGSNVSFTDNVFATDIPWQYGPVYPGADATFRANGNMWRRNTLKVRPGTIPYAGSILAWTSADDGKFMLPDGTLSAVDFAG